MYKRQEQGLLTGKVTMDTTYPEGSTRNTNPCFQPCLLYTSLHDLS